MMQRSYCKRSRRISAARPSPSGCRRPGGFTLVELLVAMAVTLILILALSQAFALVGEVVSQGRAAIEMAGSVRNVAHRLQEDLDGLTVPARPWAEEGAGGGYLEITDGPSTDYDWNDDGTFDTDPLISNTTYGDIDDVLAFTARSKGAPFVGERFDYSTTPAMPYTIQSTVAEIVWWIQFEDSPDNATGNGVWDVDEPFTIYRRVMLIRPDLGVVFNRTGAAAYSQDQTGLALLRSELIEFFSSNDISVRLNWSIANNQVQVQLVANSLADLTRRENRFAHKRILSDRAPSNPGNELSVPPVAVDGTWRALQSPQFPYALDLNRRSVTSLYRSPKSGANAGEDVMLTDALAFDVRVFDPKAAVRASANSGEVLAPGDAAYFSGNPTWPTYPNLPVVNPPTWLGYGAFVDLGYAHGDSTDSARLRLNLPPFSGITPSGAQGSSLFSGPPLNSANTTLANPPANLRGLNAAGVNWRTPTYTYCTWSTHYERDGIDQDNDGVVDQGTDGFDNDGQYGVDDVGERETAPPYPHPLRGIQVTIRAIERDTRQIRQASVIADFMPE